MQLSLMCIVVQQLVQCLSLAEFLLNCPLRMIQTISCNDCTSDNFVFLFKKKLLRISATK